MAKLIVESKGTMVDRIKAVLARARGAYSIVLCTQTELYAFRDPWGVRPLCLGRLGEGGYVVASESCALGTVGAQYVREIERGEIVRIGPDGLESHQDRGRERHGRRSACSSTSTLRVPIRSSTNARSTWRATRWAASSPRNIPSMPTS